MKPYFDQDGHLTGRAFDDLLHGEPDELARLEIAAGSSSSSPSATPRASVRTSCFPPRKRCGPP